MNVYFNCPETRTPIFSETSPVPLEILNDPSEQVSSTICFSCTGSGFLGGEVGKPALFEIFCKDENGRPAEVEENKIKAFMAQPGKKNEMRMNLVSKGCWKADFTPRQDGEWQIIVEYGKEIAFQKTAVFAGRAEGTHCQVLRPPNRVQVGVPSSFQLQGQDRMGNAVKFGGEKFTCAVAGPPGATNCIGGFTILDEANGFYTVKFTCNVKGKYEFSIKLRDREVNGSPVELTAQ